LSDIALGPNHRVRVTAELIRAAPLLDVGAGPCLLERYVRGPYVATDLSASALQPGTDRAVSEMGALPFRSESFGAVACVSVLQYVVDVNKALREVHRVLRPGGQLVLLVPNLAYVRNTLQLIRGRLPWCSPLDSWTGGTVRYFTLADFMPALEGAGFEVHDVVCTGGLRKLRSRVPSVLGADLVFDAERC
jgi:SAM-dependent methyltransferase